MGLFLNPSSVKFFFYYCAEKYHSFKCVVKVKVKVKVKCGVVDILDVFETFSQRVGSRMIVISISISI